MKTAIWPARLGGSALVAAALVSTGLVSTGLVSTGLVSTGLVSTALVSTALVSTALVSTALVSSALVSTGLSATRAGSWFALTSAALAALAGSAGFAASTFAGSGLALAGFASATVVAAAVLLSAVTLSSCVTASPAFASDVVWRAAESCELLPGLPADLLSDLAALSSGWDADLPEEASDIVALLDAVLPLASAVRVGSRSPGVVSSAAALTPSGWPTVDRSSREAAGLAAPAFGSAAATGCGATLSVGSSGCAKLAGIISPGVTTTRAPILVQFHILMANAIGIRMQPCEAGYPGSTPAWI